MISPLHCYICSEPIDKKRLAYRSITCGPEHSNVRDQRMKKGDASGNCVVCTKPVPHDRTKFGAVTCTRACGAKQKSIAAGLSLLKKCFQCRRPSTPIERSAYRRFRSLEITRPDLLYPGAFKKWDGDLPSFAAALQESLYGARPGDESGDVLPWGSRYSFDLELVTRKSKERPGGAASGRKPIPWKGGDPDCKHRTHREGDGRKKAKANQQNKCTKCGAKRTDREEQVKHGNDETGTEGSEQVSAQSEMEQAGTEGPAV
jgi:hypothetical protein